MSRQSRNAYYRAIRTKDLEEMLKITGFEYKWYTPYQLRIWTEDWAIDFYPTNGKYHNLASGKYKNYNTKEDLRKIIEKETRI